MADSVCVLVGTRKGAFIYRADERRACWSLSAPLLPGWSFAGMAADTRQEPPLLYGAANHWAWGRAVAKSGDGGATWDYRSEGLAFPAEMGIAVQNAWCVQPGLACEPGVVYCGTQPAGLFRSEDWGRSWQPVEGLNRHPHRRYWSGSGGGDSCVHSIELDPRDPAHLYVAISSGGTYETCDGGASWALVSQTAIVETPAARAFITRISADFPNALPPGIDPMAVDEMHKLRLDRKDPARLWGQTHVGVFRSDDGGASWADVTAGLPSYFGFPIAVTKRAPDAAFVVPLEFDQDNSRLCTGQLTVYRTRDGGKNWEPLTCGLPGPHDYQSVYRDGLDTDGLSPEGVYVGTSNGQVYASVDGGDHWQRLPGTLPPVLSVTCAVLPG